MTKHSINSIRWPRARLVALIYLALAAPLGACSSQGVDERHLNNNGSGADRDATRHVPDTIAQQFLDTVPASGQRAPGNVRTDTAKRLGRPR